MAPYMQSRGYVGPEPRVCSWPDPREGRERRLGRDQWRAKRLIGMGRGGGFVQTVRREIESGLCSVGEEGPLRAPPTGFIPEGIGRRALFGQGIRPAGSTPPSSGPRSVVAVLVLPGGGKGQCGSDPLDRRGRFPVEPTGPEPATRTSIRLFRPIHSQKT